MTATAAAVDRERYRRRWPAKGIYRDVLERTADAADSRESIADRSDHCAKCGRGVDEGLQIYVAWAETEAAIDANVGPLNASDPYMARKPGDEFVFATICPCCSFEGCPDTERGHLLATLAERLRSRYVERVMWEWPLVAATTSPDHPEWQETWPGGPVLRVAADAICWEAVGHNVEHVDDEGRRVITGYQEPGACGRPQCINLRAEAQAEHAGDPDDCSSLCPICFPRALVVVPAAVAA